MLLHHAEFLVPRFQLIMGSLFFFFFIKIKCSPKETKFARRAASYHVFFLFCLVMSYEFEILATGINIVTSICISYKALYNICVKTNFLNRIPHAIHLKKKKTYTLLYYKIFSFFFSLMNINEKRRIRNL